MPDIDMDFDSRYRDQMIRYASDKYGRDHVAQIITFGTIKARNAVRDAARVLGKPYVVGDKIAFVEESLAKVRKLRQTDDTKDIVQASIALHEYVLPVYRNEYQQLAKLYDGGAAKAEIDGLASAISTKYGPGVAVLFDRLTTAGKAYAAKHEIKVRWDVRTSPAN
jgi:hypothetical protein